MTVREWFRVLRRERDARGPGEEAYEATLAHLRAGNWGLAEFWWLLLRTRLAAWTAGRHVWAASADGYWWTCAGCGAQVGRDLDDVGPNPTWFEADCQCRACRPCTGTREEAE